MARTRSPSCVPTRPCSFSSFSAVPTLWRSCTKAPRTKYIPSFPRQLTRITTRLFFLRRPHRRLTMPDSSGVCWPMTSSRSAEANLSDTTVCPLIPGYKPRHPRQYTLLNSKYRRPMISKLSNSPRLPQISRPSRKSPRPRGTGLHHSLPPFPSTITPKATFLPSRTTPLSWMLIIGRTCFWSWALAMTSPATCNPPLTVTSSLTTCTTPSPKPTTGIKCTSDLCLFFFCAVPFVS